MEGVMGEKMREFLDALKEKLDLTTEELEAVRSDRIEATTSTAPRAARLVGNHASVGRWRDDWQDLARSGYATAGRFLFVAEQATDPDVAAAYREMARKFAVGAGQLSEHVTAECMRVSEAIAEELVGAPLHALTKAADWLEASKTADWTPENWAGLVALMDQVKPR
jgi:hypothetical protein